MSGAGPEENSRAESLHFRPRILFLSADPGRVRAQQDGRQQTRAAAGRSGPGQVWLASPPTIAASAIAGEIVSFAELQQRAC